MNDRPLTLLASLATLLLAGSAPGAQSLATERIASGLNRPIWAGSPAGDDRVFIAEKAGVIKVLAGGELRATPFLSITGTVNSASTERGLLGMTFHPGFASNGEFFLNYTDAGGDTVISRWRVSTSDPDVADPLSEEVILNVNQPFANHNAGALFFGLDGFLYIPLGDGGSANDPGCRAQHPLRLLGKILRIDVDTGSPYSVPPSNPFVGLPEVLPEIYHLGLRNPFRTTVDRLTGDIYIGDVGQNAREEISVAPAGVGGLNFGWKILEGTRCNSSLACPTLPGCGSPTYTAPIWELVQTGLAGPRAIIGGHVYRGCAIPGLEGTYFFADNNDNRIRSLRYDVPSGQVSAFTDRTSELAPGGGLAIQDIASFGEDGQGELLIVEDRSAPNGEVYKIVQAGAPAALATPRNGSGTNATCYSSQSLPIVGASFRVTVDVSGFPGATQASIVGYSAGTSGVFFKGSEILVDLASAPLFSVGQAVTAAEVVFAPTIPCDPSLSGVTAATQALVLGSPPIRFCNAIDVTLGAF